MNRILRRPMFRMGGTPNEGIMTGLKEPRLGYAEGLGPITSPELFAKRQRLEREDFLTPAKIDEMYKKQLQQAEEDVLFGAVEDIGGPGTYAERIENIALFGGTKEGEEMFKKPLREKMKKQIEERKALGIPISTELKLSTKNPELPSNKPGAKTEIVEIPKKQSEPSDEETIKSYMDMFSKAFKESPEDISRQRYLELAKFGANLLAQPGGSLVGAIGKAAAPAIEGLTKSELARKAGDREVKLAALQTAIRQMDNPTMDKIKALAKASGLDESVVAKNLILDKTADTVKADSIKRTSAALSENIGGEAGLRAAETMAEAGLTLASVTPLPVDKDNNPKEGSPDGFYYDTDGKIYRVKDGKPALVKIK